MVLFHSTGSLSIRWTKDQFYSCASQTSQNRGRLCTPGISRLAHERSRQSCSDFATPYGSVASGSLARDFQAKIAEPGCHFRRFSRRCGIGTRAPHTASRCLPSEPLCTHVVVPAWLTTFIGFHDDGFRRQGFESTRGGDFIFLSLGI